MIDLRRLQVLRVLHQQSTVTATARILHLTPSAVSQQIRQLSKETGVQLLHHQGRRVRLTEAALTLLGHADSIYERWEQVRGDLAAHSDSVRGQLRLCGFASSFSTLLAPAAAEIRRTYPQIWPELTDSSIDEAFEMLLAEDVDIAVLPVPGCPPLDDPRFDQQPLLDDTQDLIVHSTHAFATRDSVALSECAAETWIEPHHDQYRLIVNACVAAGFTPRLAHRAAEWTSVLALVNCGLGVCLLPRLVPVGSDYDIVRVPMHGEVIPSRRILTSVRRGSRTQPVIAAGLDTLRKTSRTAFPHSVDSAP